MPHGAPRSTRGLCRRRTLLGAGQAGGAAAARPAGRGRRLAPARAPRRRAAEGRRKCAMGRGLAGRGRLPLPAALDHG
eukprot:2993697-Alexandrium_andersonii.AAC.1